MTLTWLRRSRRRLVGGVSAEQLEKIQYLHRATWKRKLKEIEGSKLKKIQVSETLGSSQVKKIEGSFRQDPSVQSSIRKSLRMWISRNAQTNGGRQKRSRSSVARRKNDESRSEPGYYVSESGQTRMRILHQLGACWMLPGVDYFSFVHHGTVAPSPETYTKVCKWCASKRSQRNQMSRTLRRPPS